MGESMEAQEFIYAGVAIIPLIVASVVAIKRLAKILPKVGPSFQNAPDDLWFGLSLFLGIVLASAVYAANEGIPSDGSTALALSLWGLYQGLAASKAYDEAMARTNI